MTQKTKNRIYFFHGADTYRAEKKVHEWRKTFLEKFGPGTVKEIEPNGENLRLSAIVAGQSLFSKEALYLIKNPLETEGGDSFIDWDDFFALVESALPEAVYLVLWQKGSLDKRLNVTKKILQVSEKGHIEALEFLPLAGDEVLKFIASELVAYKLTIKRDAALLLIDYLSTGTVFNSWAAANAIRQLAAYCTGKEMVEISDVKTLIAPQSSDDVFLPLLQSFAKKDQKKLLQFFNELVEQQSSEQELLGILSALFEQAKNMLLVQDLKNEGLSLNEIDGSLGFKPGRSRYLLQDASKFSKKELNLILDRLLELEFELKSGKTVLAPALANMLQSI